MKKTRTICIFLLLILSLSCGSGEKKPPVKAGEHVILLHGLTRTSRSMAKLEKSLSSHGFSVINVSYPSRKLPIEYLANTFFNDVIKPYLKTSPPKIHFVTHSMGGIIIRYYLKYHEITNLGRTVMLSPPNQGSELVDRLKNDFLIKKIYGPVVQQLGTDKESIPLNLGPVNFELGIIAGNRSFNPINSLILPGPDDGVVSVERTKVEGMKDFLILPQTHTFIMQSQDVIDQVIHFLKHGEFTHSKKELLKGTS